MKALLQFLKIIPKPLNFEGRLGERELDFLATHELPVKLYQGSSGVYIYVPRIHDELINKDKE